MEQETGGSGFVPTPIDDILRADDAAPSVSAGQPEPQAAPAPRETGETAAPPAQDDRPRDDAGRFAPKADAAPQSQDTGTPPAEDGPKHVPVSVAIEERKKRQAAEREREELRAQLAAYQRPAQPQAPQQQAQPAPDFWADPDAHMSYREQQILQRVEQQMLAERIALSEAFMRQKPDYDDAIKALETYAGSSPQAGVQVAQFIKGQQVPAAAAYEQGKKLMAAQKWAPIQQQHSDPEAFINAEVERRLAARQPSPASSSVPQPPASLASARSAAPRMGSSAFTGPTPLTSILGRR